MSGEPSDEAAGRATRCGFVALIGAPNVGKSTLVNALVGSKVTIVSRKVQTTRALIRGIVIENHAQVDHPKILVINKIDIVAREKLLKLAQTANERLKFAETFMVSAMTGDGVDDLRHTLAAMVPPGPFHYPEDQMSDAPMRHLAAEITREKIFRQLHQELPYQSTVETDSWTERKDKSIRIEQTIFVERESQRKIVLGKGGATIKSIGAEARKEIAEIVAVPVHLFLFVKVRENWGDDPDRYREMGLEFPKE